MKKKQIEIPDCYVDFLTRQEFYNVLYGGAGSGKSWAACFKVLTRLINEPGHNIICMRKVGETVGKSVWPQLVQTISNWDIESLFNVNKSERTLTYLPNGGKIQCMGLDNVEKLKSIYLPTGFWLEEATEFSPADLAQIGIRMRGETPSYKQIILTFNPVSSRHFLRKMFVQNKHPDAYVLKTTYLDNPFLDHEQYEQQLTQGTDQNFQDVYLKGEWGNLIGLVFNPFPVCDNYEEIKKKFTDTAFGLDFGFNDPCALIQISKYDNELYAKELLYEYNLSNRN